MGQDTRRSVLGDSEEASLRGEIDAQTTTLRGRKVEAFAVNDETL
jgi:hypothetical protein